MKHNFIRLTLLLALIGTTSVVFSQSSTKKGNVNAWRANLASSGNQLQREIFPGVDAIFSGSSYQLYSHFIINPGANPAAIALNFDQAQATDVSSNHQATIATATGKVALSLTKIAQTENGQEKLLDAKIVKRPDGQIGLELLEAFNPNQPVVVTFISEFKAAGDTAPQTTSDDSEQASGSNSIALLPPIASVTATKVDTVQPANTTGPAYPGSTIKYTVVIKNTGTEDIPEVEYVDTIDPNTTFTPGSLKTTPLARNDNYPALNTQTLNIAAPGVLSNDNDPDGSGGLFAIAQSGAATTQGGTVTLNTDGSFTYDAPSSAFTGVDDFTYTIQDADGNTNDATVTITVNSGDAAPYVTNISPTNGATGVSITPTVTVTFSEPVYFSGAGATLVGSTSGSHILNSSFNSSTEVAFTLNPSSSPLNYNETITFTVVAADVYDQDIVDPPNYMAANFVSTFTTTAAAPVTNADSYNSIGNVGITVPAANGVLANDTGTPAPTVVAAAGGTTNGGAFSIGADGGFSYLPAVGFEGTDQFTYTVTNSGGSANGTVTINVNEVIWFIDNSIVSSGNGTLSSPYKTIQDYGTAALNEAGDIIFIYTGTGNYIGDITLENNQTVIGQGASASIASITGITVPPYSNTLPASGGSRPVLGNSFAGVRIKANNTLRGFDIGNTTAGGAGIANIPQNVSFGTLTINDMSIGGSGRAILILGEGTLAVTLDNLTSSADANGLVFWGSPGIIDGSFTVNGATTISNSTVIGLNIINSSASYDFGTTSVTNNTDIGVNLVNNSSASFTFDALTVSTTAGAGLFANNSGTVTVLGTSNTINSGSNSAINMTNTTIGASGMTFQSITSSGGSATGIILDNTGTSGGLTVTGTGTAGSGGTIANKLGIDGSTTNGIGIYLNNTRGVRLSWMQLNDFNNFAIRGTSVTDFQMRNTIINGTNGTNAASVEGSVSFDNLFERALFDGVSISGGRVNNIIVTNTSGTLDTMTVINSTIGLNDQNNGNDGILVKSQNSAVVSLSITNSSFLGARYDMVETNATGTSIFNLLIKDNTFNNTHSNVQTGAGGIGIFGGSAGGNITMNYEVSGTSAGSQTIRGAVGNAIDVKVLNGSGSVNGLIRNNNIGNSSFSGSGSTEGSGILVGADVSIIHSVVIENNNIVEVDGFAGIDVFANGASTLNLTATGNSVSGMGSFAFTGMALGVGVDAGDTAILCSDIRNNSINSSGSATAYGARFTQVSTLAHFNLPQYAGATGGATASTDIATYLAGRGNTITPGASASAVQASTTSGITGTGTGCTP